MAGSPDVITRIVDRNVGVYHVDPGRLREDVNQESQIAEDYRGRLVYELLQNADDAMDGQAAHDDRVAFLITDDEMWMANTGRPLTEEDVIGLCGLGASSKTDAEGTRRASIGHKGLGFKSVLEITECPAAYSTTYRFELGEGHARPYVDALWRQQGRPTPRRVPTMRFPAPLEERSDIWDQFRADRCRTAFRFPFRATVGADKRRALVDQLLGLPLTTVLFLKHLERIDVRVEQRGRSLTDSWQVTRQLFTDGSWCDTTGIAGSGLYRIAVRSTSESVAFLVAHDADVPIGEHRLGLSGPAWEGVALTEVSVAVTDPEVNFGQLDPSARRFHVFLPTEQACPYPMLVNGAFATDLSRQRVKVTDEDGDYNVHLIRAAARLFRNRVVPALMAYGPREVLTRLARSTSAEDDTAGLLHQALVSELADVPLLPANETQFLTFAQAVVPPAHLEQGGATYRQVLADETSWQDRSFPVADYCVGELGRIVTDHGAAMLTGGEAMEVLGVGAHPNRATLVPHESGGFEVDPVLELSVDLWYTADADERPAIKEAARQCEVFPVHRHDDGTVRRIPLGDDTAFYPARAARHDLPLAGLQFLCHDVCWGALLPKERTELLGERMVAWTGLFGIRDFDFEQVMRAAVIPALRLDPDLELIAQREDLKNMGTLAAICQLAGKRPKPGRPLRYERLGSDRALFNLARLPLPCRSANGEERWEPAFTVYFGSDWIGHDSIEDILATVSPDDPMAPYLAGINYLAPPQQFLGLLDFPADDAGHHATDVNVLDDEVDVDEDSDIPLETSEHERWNAFLSWIGVNHALRPVHFHDVEDRGAGWLSTKGLERPQGWAFSRLGRTWDDFRARLHEIVLARRDATVDPYLYQAHDLEFLVPLLDAAARDNGGTVGARLLEHLVRHWRYYADFLETEIAVVGKGKSPSQRSKPPRAMPEERTTAGDNLWVFRLRRAAFCPTTHGPRRPDQTWLATSETARRFGQRGRDAGDFLPLLELEDLDSQRNHAVAQHLGIRTELSPATFSVGDARLLTERLRVLHEGDNGTVDIAAHVMSTTIRPVYRELFELLSGQSDAVPGEEPPLREAPLLVQDGDSLRFVTAATALYARGPGMKERSGVAGRLPIFVLEAHPAANAPLSRLFGVRILDEILNWEPSPGELALDDAGLDDFRSALRALAPALAARIRAERHEPRDLRLLTEFVERVEPVDELTLTCNLDGTHVRTFEDRPYFVTPATGSRPLKAFVVWRSPGWPPGPDEQHSMAMALADLLGLNLVEAFLAFLGTDDQGRLRLLDTAGALGHLSEVLAAGEAGQPDPAPAAPTSRTIEPAPDPSGSEQPASRSTELARPAGPRIPLHDFSTLRIHGEPLLITGEPAAAAGSRQGGRDGAFGKFAAAAPVAAPGVDLQALDGLGMQIAATYELRRLQRALRSPAIVGLGHAPNQSTPHLVIDVSTPGAIRSAEDHPVAKAALVLLEQVGVSRIHPGFDLLTVVDGRPDRLIELKSSATDARVQAMTWNEWKSARNSRIRARFWLYVVGNLRADLPHAKPYVRAIHDPFGTLTGDEISQEQVRRAVQLRVREFASAEHLDLAVTSRRESTE